MGEQVQDEHFSSFFLFFFGGGGGRFSRTWLMSMSVSLPMASGTSDFVKARNWRMSMVVHGCYCFQSPFSRISSPPLMWRCIA